MKQIQFSIQIKASKEKVWQTLWQDQTFRKWASVIDPGTYMLGELKEGNEVEFMSEQNGYGVTSYVEKLIPEEFLLLKHKSDTQNSGKNLRDEQWSGGSESYSLLENAGTTELTVMFGVPEELEEYFNENYPKALNVLKDLVERDS